MADPRPPSGRPGSGVTGEGRWGVGAIVGTGAQGAGDHDGSRLDAEDRARGSGDGPDSELLQAGDDTCVDKGEDRSEDKLSVGLEQGLVEAPFPRLNRWLAIGLGTGLGSGEMIVFMGEKRSWKLGVSKGKALPSARLSSR